MRCAPSARCEPAIATGAAKEETRWALYRSWVGWPLGETAVSRVPGAGAVRTDADRHPPVRPAAHRAGVAVKVWTVNAPADMRRLVSIGVDALITDRPDLARSVIPLSPQEPPHD